jgi:transcriptional regulator with XRE-family HTH domain
MKKREKLVAARLGKGWSQEALAEKVGVTRNTLSAWERGIANPYPVHVQRLCDVFATSAEELSLVNSKDVALNIPTIEGSSIEILEQTAMGIAACNTFSDHGGHDEIVAATQIVATYLPTLKALLPTTKHRLQAAALMSKIFQHQHGTAYHLGSVRQSLEFSVKAIEYARLGEDIVEQIIALYELSSTYEWPLPPLSVYACRRKGLELLEEAVQLQEKHRDIVAAPIQAQIYTGYAKFLALNNKKQEAYTAIGKAQECFVKKDRDIPGLYFNEVNIARQQAIAHSYLNEQSNAIRSFLGLIDPNTPDTTKLPMHTRTHLSLLSETVYSLLKLPNAEKDKELTIRLWKVQFDMAQALKSATYIKEAWTTYEIMGCVWPGDPEVDTLKEALLHSETIE